MKLESGDCGSHPHTRKASPLGALGGGMLACLYQTDWCQALFTLFIEQYVTNLYESAMSILCVYLYGYANFLAPRHTDACPDN
jgi:hypothetical protein